MESKIWMWPKSSPTNKYNELLSDALERREFTVLNFRWRNALKIKRRDTLYFHWIHSDYQHNNLLIMMIKSFLLIVFFLYLKVMNVKLVWTLHNLYPHSYKYKWLERIVRNIVLKIVDNIFVASDSIKLSVLQEYRSIPEQKISIIKHGHYRGVYPEKQINFRKEYGIDENETVYLFFGAIKKYKGVINLINNFIEVAKENDRLIIAGKPDEEMEKELAPHINNPDNRIIFDLRFLPDDELVPLIKSSDFVVLPFEAITTSGSAILAASYEKTVITINHPTFKEYFTSGMAILYEGNTKLKEAMILSHHYKKQQNEYEEFLRETDWDTISFQISTILRE